MITMSKSFQRVVALDPVTKEPLLLFRSASIAAQYFDTYVQKIRSCCKSQQPFKGYIFKDAIEWETENYTVLPGGGFILD